MKTADRWRSRWRAALVALLGFTAMVPAAEEAKPRGIILVAFGTSVPEARGVYDRIEAAARKRFPGHDISLAFTATTIVAKLRAAGDASVRTLPEALAQMKEGGAGEVVLQSLHVVPGQKDAELRSAGLAGLRISCGAPLLAGEADVTAVAEILGGEVPAGVPTVFIVHGNDKFPEYNRMNLALAAAIEAKHPLARVCSVEGAPGTAGLEALRPEVAKAEGRVHFVPVMIVAGDHVLNDAMGDEPESWKNRLGSTAPTCGKPLGDHPAILERFWLHLEAALAAPAVEAASVPSPESAGRRMHGRSGGESRRRKVEPTGEHGRIAAGMKDRDAVEGGAFSRWQRWRRQLGFWQQKGVLFLEIALTIALGVLLGQILDATGITRRLSVVTSPLLRLGRLPREAGPPFIVAFQSGAAANAMLVAERDGGALNRRQLYTAVLVVGALSLFAHLPTFIGVFGATFGAAAGLAYFSVRVGAIAAEIVAILLVSRCFGRRESPPAQAAGPVAVPVGGQPPVASAVAEVAGFWSGVWSRSARTLKRVLLAMVPAYWLLAWIENAGAFEWLEANCPSLFSLSFLPAQAAAIIPMQVSSLYNGVIAAANFLDSGELTAHQAVLILLVGSILTAPIRTFKHALPTYVAILGARSGPLMAAAAQVLRCLFVALAILVMELVWR